MVGALLLGLGLILAATASSVDAVEKGAAITKIDMKTRTVTAYDERTKQTFQFKVLGNALLSELKVGQEVYADFKAMKVSVRSDGTPPCCNIVTIRSAGTTPAPCCSVTAISLNTGMVTAVDKATGRRFQFKVAEWRTLTGVRIGQSIHANFKTMMVSLRPDGATPCCGIVRR
jgi:Cu/Ag efflux protein CusF